MNSKETTTKKYVYQRMNESQCVARLQIIMRCRRTRTRVKMSLGFGIGNLKISLVDVFS